MSLDEKFQAACKDVFQFQKKPTDVELLEMYAFYKQATVGDVNIPKPNDVKGKIKWDAWNSKRGLTKNVAKEKYLESVKKLSPKYT